jgi:hypothetical protein
MTLLLAIAGLALALYGVVVFAAFAVAGRVFARAQKTEAFAWAQQSGAVRMGDDLAQRAIEKIPLGFLRNLVRRRLGASASAYGVAMIEERLRASRSFGGWVAVAGLALFASSFWLGPRLSQMVSGWGLTG